MINKTIKAIGIYLLLATSLNGQLFLSENSSLRMIDGDILHVEGHITLSDDSELLLGEGTLSFSGDLNSEGTVVFDQATLKLFGSEDQSLSHSNGSIEVSTLQLSKDSGFKGVFNTPVSVSQEILLEGGIIDAGIAEVSLLNSSPDALSGYQIPNGIDGTYPDNDKYIIGSLNWHMLNGSYTVPMGSDALEYNPVIIDVEAIDETTMNISFKDSELGMIDKSINLNCDGTEAYMGSASQTETLSVNSSSIEYNEMLGKAYWELSADQNLDFGLVVFPNTLNDLDGAEGMGFQVLRQELGVDPTADWTPAEVPSNTCIVSTNVFESLGSNFSSSGIFGISQISIASFNENLITDVDLEVYPNPTTDMLIVKNDNETFKSVIVIDAIGKVCLKSPLAKSTNIDLSSFSSGSYILRFVDNENSVFVKRVVKN